MRKNEKQSSGTVEIDDAICNGTPRLQGTRLTVLDVISNAIDADDHSMEISEEHLRAVLDYCINRQCDRDNAHCGGCSLRAHQDGVFTPEQFTDRFAKVCFEDSEEVITGRGEGVKLMPGSPATLNQTWYGVNGWIMAGIVRNRLTQND